MKMLRGKPAVLLAGLICWAWLSRAQSSGPTASPNSLSFAYQINSTTFPAAAKVTVTLPASMGTTTITVSVSSAPWLAVTPDRGRAPLTLTATVNPTGLPPGNYAGTIDLSAPPGSPVSVPVSLAISNPPSTLVVSSAAANYSPPTSGATAALTFAYTTGAAATSPDTTQLDVSSTGDVIPFNVTAGGASGKGSSGGSGTGAVWLRVKQAGQQLSSLTTSGVALSGSTVPIIVSLDLTTVSTLDPGSYTGIITVAATNAVNGTVTVTANLVVSAGDPTLGSIFPTKIIAGPVLDPVFTINGDNFFSTSVVTILQQGANQPITVPTKLLSRKVLQATVKAAYLAPLAAGSTATYPVTWTLKVMNPATATNPTPPQPSANFLVTDPALPGITSVSNAASFLSTAVHTGTGRNPVAAGAMSVSPREIISIFGENLGPATATPLTPSGSPAVYPTTSGGVTAVAFLIGTDPPVNAPLLMISSNQINCIVPIEVAKVIGTATPTVLIQVTTVTGSATSDPITVVAEDPGVFTFGGLGQGQAAVLNFDSASGSFIINSSKSAASKGTTIAIYATGLGDLALQAAVPPAAATPVPNGVVPTSGINLADATCRVDIDGQPAVVSYAGTSPGSVSGLVQINAIVPPTVKTGAAISITVSIGSTAASRRSQPGVTLSVK